MVPALPAIEMWPITSQLPYAGHGRVLAAGELRMEMVPTVRQSHLSADERRAYVLADNKLALNAGWDKEILAIERQALIDVAFDVTLTGFSLAELGSGLIDQSQKMIAAAMQMAEKKV